MPTQPVVVFNLNTLVPARHPELAFVQHGQFAPNLNLPSGQAVALNTVLGKIAAYNPSAPTTPVNAVQLITLSGVPASGNYKISVTFNGTTQQTGNVAWNANAAAVQSAVQSLSNVGAGNATVTLPTTEEIQIAFTGLLGGQPIAAVTFTPVALEDSGSTAITGAVTTTTTGVLVDGTGTCKGLLVRPTITDEYGNVVNQEWGALEDTGPYWYTGCFNTWDITGLDAAGLAALGGRVIEGTLSHGVIKF